MRNLAVSLLLALCASSMHAQETKDKDEGFKFTVVKENPVTSIKDQSRSGTCWAYSSIGFFEAELIRQGRGEWDFSEMFLAHKTYQDRAKASVRLHGDISFTEGGSFYDCVYCMKHYGLVPRSAMPAPGSLQGDSLPNFRELFSTLTPMVNAVAKDEQGKRLSPIWQQPVTATLDAYLGVCPAEFEYKGNTYTPQSYMKATGLDMDDYVSLTSYTHHPFYEPFILEIPDNWRWGTSYNLPLNELMEVMDTAVRSGYTFAWGADVSEKGFTRNGVAVCPDLNALKNEADVGTDFAKWFGKAASSDGQTARPLPEINVTQTMRQEAYDNWETTDDHGMLVYGIAKDQSGTEYFIVKNSWGAAGTYEGVWYVSKTYAAYKTMNILIHKDAIPKRIAKKLGI